MPFAAPDLPQTEAVILQMTNTFRAENHLPPVAPNPALQAAAQAFATYLAQTGAFAHTADGREPADRARAAGYQFCIVAENIALHQSNRGYETSDLAGRAVNGWIHSPAHRANLLQPSVTEIGIGIAAAPTTEPKYLTVQLLGRPSSLKYVFEIENRSGAASTYALDGQPQTIANAMRIKHTACTPRDLTFDTGKVTAKFETRDGATFAIIRGADGTPRVEVQQSSVTAVASPPPRSPRKSPPANVLAAKAVKPTLVPR